jgi:hypothetical protein
MKKVVEGPKKNRVWALKRTPALTNKAASEAAEGSHVRPQRLQRRECGDACSLRAQYALT